MRLVLNRCFSGTQFTPPMLTRSSAITALRGQQVLKGWDKDGDGRLSTDEKGQMFQSIGSWLAGLAGYTAQLPRVGRLDV